MTAFRGNHGKRQDLTQAALPPASLPPVAK